MHDYTYSKWNNNILFVLEFIMPIDTTALESIKTKLASYVKSWTAYALLTQSMTGEETVTQPEFKELFEQLKTVKGNKLTVADLIKGIIDTANSRPEAIQWKKEDKTDVLFKDLVISFSGVVFTVTLKKINDEDYTVDIKGALKREDDILVFNPPKLAAGETKIHYNTDGTYLIDAGYHIPMIDSHHAKPPRPLQLNAVRSYAIAINEKRADPAQLALLGTGTGKSFVIASAAEAVGSSVIVLPTPELASEMLNDAMMRKLYAGKMQDQIITLSCAEESVEIKAYGAINGEGISPPYVVLAQDIKNKDDFERLLKRDDVHIILSASDSRFHDFIPLVKNKLLLIDETHQHAYTAEQAKTLEEVCQNNATLGLTGTPTGHLFNAFKDHACVEFNLGNAMKAGLLRSLDYQDLSLSSTQTSDFVDAAILSYFNPVYLNAGDPGYRPLKKPATLEDVLQNFLPPNQKAMIFSDKQSVLIEIQNTLLSIESATLAPEKAAFYAATIRERRIEALKKQLDINHVSYTEEELEAAIPEVDLQKELIRTRVKAIKNTVFSYALSLLFKSEDRQKFSSLLRSHGLTESYLLAQAKYTPLNNPEDLQSRIDNLVELNTLPEPYLSELKTMIKDTTQALDDKIKTTQPSTMADVSRIFNQDLSTSLKTSINQVLEENPSPTVITIQMESKDEDVKQHLAELKYGLASIALSDQRWATGVSIEDVLTSIIVNTRLNFKEHNAVCAPLGAAQAVGRAVRNKDLRGSATMISSADIPRELIYTVEQILALDSGEQSKKILAAWDNAREKYEAVYHAQTDLGLSPEEAEELAYQAACDIVRQAVHAQLPPEVAEEIIPEEITLTREGSVSGKASNSGLFSTSSKLERQRSVENKPQAPGDDETPPPLTRGKTI